MIIKLHLLQTMIILLCTCQLSGQNITQRVPENVITITMDSTRYLTENINEVRKRHLNSVAFIFKDSLLDGTYYLMESIHDSDEGIDSAKILYTGTFIDGKKNGSFKSFQTCKLETGSGSQNVQLEEFNFKNGILDGYVRLRDCHHIIYEGHYKSGLKNGLFIQYDRLSGSVARIDFFVNDTLIFYSLPPLLADTIEPNTFVPADASIPLPAQTKTHSHSKN